MAPYQCSCSYCCFSIFLFGFCSRMSATTNFDIRFHQKYFSNGLYHCYITILYMWPLLARWYTFVCFSSSTMVPYHGRRCLLFCWCFCCCFTLAYLQVCVQPLVFIPEFIRSTFLRDYMTVILKYWTCNLHQYDGVMSQFPVFFLPVQWYHITVSIVYWICCCFYLTYCHGWVWQLVLIGYFVRSILLNDHITHFEYTWYWETMSFLLYDAIILWYILPIFIQIKYMFYLFITSSWNRKIIWKTVH